MSSRNLAYHMNSMIPAAGGVILRNAARVVGSCLKQGTANDHLKYAYRGRLDRVGVPAQEHSWGVAAMSEAGGAATCVLLGLVLIPLGWFYTWVGQVGGRWQVVGGLLGGSVSSPNTLNPTRPALSWGGATRWR